MTHSGEDTLKQIAANPDKYDLSIGNYEEDPPVTDAILVPAIVAGNAPVLHLRWQEQGVVLLTENEAKALPKRIPVKEDESGYYLRWRRRKLSHIWLSDRGEYCIQYSRRSKLKDATRRDWRVLTWYGDPNVLVRFNLSRELTMWDIVSAAMSKAVASLEVKVPAQLLEQESWNEGITSLIEDAVARYPDGEDDHMHLISVVRVHPSGVGEYSARRQPY